MGSADLTATVDSTTDPAAAPAPPPAAASPPPALPPPASAFDVFLSHSSKDKPAVLAVATRLRELGIEPWLDAWCLTPGGRWQEELAAGLAASGACAVFVGPGDLGAWEIQELGLALERAAKDRAFRLFPVLLPGVADPFDPARLPPFLALRTWVDLRPGIERADVFQRLVNAVHGVPFGAGGEVAPAAAECPYQGLAPFDEEQAGLFFGREGDVQRLLEKLKSSRFLAVLGPSGSGKSSLVRAGLLPAIRDGALPASEGWPRAVIRPGSSPLAALAARLLELAPDRAMQATVDGLAADRRTLHLAVALALADRPEARYVLVVDQFEEAFTLCRTEDERRAFLDNLVYAATVPEGRCIVVITLRADFYQRCAAHPALAQLLSGQQFLVTPLDDDGLRRAIEEPARRVGLTFEEGLVETIAEDVAEQPGALPLLEHALLELWERRRGTMMTLEGYRATGGVQGALAQRADEVFGSLAPADQELARGIFLRLTQPTLDQATTRRRASLEELAAAPFDEAAVARVVTALVEGRLVTTGADPGGGQWAEVSHEALLRSWPRLLRWIEDDREGLRLQHRLSQAAQEWKEAAQDEGLLYRGVRLAQAEHWLASGARSLNDLEREFLDRSLALERDVRNARRRRVRVAIGSAALTFLLIAGAAVYAFQESDRAREAARLARSRELAAAAVSRIAANPEQGLALAREAVDVTETGEAVDALRQALRSSHGLSVLDTGAGDVWSVAFGPGGRVLTGGADGIVRTWENGTVARRLATGSPLRDIEIGPGGTLLATGGERGGVRLWETASGRPLRRLATGGLVVADVAFSRDGGRVAAATADGAARVWRVRDGKLLRAVRRARGTAESVAFDPTGKRLLVGGGDGVIDNTAEIWDLSSGRRLAGLEGHADVVLAAAYGSGGRQIATGSLDGTIRLWGGTGDPQGELTGHRGPVYAVAFSADGRRLVSAGADRTVRLWDLRSGRQTAALRSHRAYVLSAVFDAEGTRVASGSGDGTARVWATEAGGAGRAVTLSRDPLEAIAFRPDGARLAAAGRDGVTRVVDARGRLLRALRVSGARPDDWIVSVAWRGDGALLATAGEDGAARLWNPATGRELRDLQGHAQGVRSVAFSPDGAVVATVSRDRTVRLWDSGSGRALRVLRGHGDRVDAVAFSQDGTRLVTAGSDATVRVWDVATGGKLLAQPAGGAAWSAAGADGMFAIGLDSGTIELWTLEGRTAELDGQTGRITGLSFSPDGKLLLSASEDGTARIWEVESGRTVTVFQPAAGALLDASFAADGRTAALAGEDGAAYLYRCDLCGSVAELDRLAAAAQRFLARKETGR